MLVTEDAKVIKHTHTQSQAPGPDSILKETVTGHRNTPEMIVGTCVTL